VRDKYNVCTYIYVFIWIYTLKRWSSRNNVDLYLGGARFDSPSAHWLFELRVFCFFIRSLQENAGILSWIGHDRFLQILSILSLIWPTIQYSKSRTYAGLTDLGSVRQSDKHSIHHIFLDKRNRACARRCNCPSLICLPSHNIQDVDYVDIYKWLSHILYSVYAIYHLLFDTSGGKKKRRLESVYSTV
jgi:hypothetical protein